MAEEAALLLELVRRGAQEATLCTEPAMVALAAAKARSLMDESPTRVEIAMSPGVMKNCLDVGLPFTDRRGPGVAAALGAVSGRSEKGLQALREVETHCVTEAHRLLDGDCVTVSCMPGREGVDCRARVAGGKRWAEVTIEGRHTHITRIEVDGQVVHDCVGSRLGSEGGEAVGDGVSLEPIKRLAYGRLFDLATDVDEGEVEYLREGAFSAFSLANEVLSGDRFLGPNGFTKALAAVYGDVSLCDGFGRSLVSGARLRVAAAVYARMAGVVWPVLTSCGSGNQGISVGIPVLLAARSVKAAPVKEARAIFLAHATNMYIKAFAGAISSLCGAVSVGAAVAAAVCWLIGGNAERVEGAAQAVLGNLYGMICDGAKASCALKCAAGVSEGILAAEMALNGAYPHGEAGIIGRGLRDTVVAMSCLSPVLNQVDPLIIGIRGVDTL